MAADLGLSALSVDLREHARFARVHGWGATLVSELTAHPRYAAAHRLFAMLAPQAGSSSSNPPSSPTTESAGTVSNGGALSTPAQPADTSSSPPVTVQDPLSTTVGGTLDVMLPNVGLGSTGLTYIITPQPLPANMLFNRQTGELVFAPDPGQVGNFNFSVIVSNGSASGTVVVPITVTDPTLSSTEVSGQVVDENGNPLADMPVSIDGSSTTTDSSGDFTLTGISADPGPISAGGSVGSSDGRLDLTAPVVQLLNHPLYANANNVILTPLILPLINWSTPANFSQASTSDATDITTPAMAGFDIQLPANPANSSLASGTLEVATLSAPLSAQHMTPGVSSGMLLYNVVGSGLSGPVNLTLPNTAGLQPGSTQSSWALFNPITGGHDADGEMVVSGRLGQTMTSTGPIAALPGPDESADSNSSSPANRQPREWPRAI